MPTWQSTFTCRRIKLTPKYSNSPSLSLREGSEVTDAAIHCMQSTHPISTVRFAELVDRHGLHPRDDESSKDRIEQNIVFARRHPPVPTRQSTATVRLIRTLLKSTPNEHPGFCKNYPAKFDDKINY